MGLAVTGEVDARTWQALFKSQVSFVGQGGKQVMTVYKPERSRARTTATAGRRRAARGFGPDDDQADRHDAAGARRTTTQPASATALR